MGLTNTIATFPGFIGPAVVGWITYRNVSILCSVYILNVKDWFFKISTNKLIGND